MSEVCRLIMKKKIKAHCIDHCRDDKNVLSVTYDDAPLFDNNTENV